MANGRVVSVAGAGLAATFCHLGVEGSGNRERQNRRYCPAGALRIADVGAARHAARRTWHREIARGRGAESLKSPEIVVSSCKMMLHRENEEIGERDDHAARAGISTVEGGQRPPWASRPG